MTSEQSKRDKEFDERFDRAKKVKVNHAPGDRKTTVFSMKMDRDLLGLLVERSAELGVGPSTLARGLIEEGLMSDGKRLSNEALLEALQLRLKEVS